MKFGENGYIYLKFCSLGMCEYGAVVRYGVGAPKVRGSAMVYFSCFVRSVLGSRNILSYKHKLLVGGSVKLGKVAWRFTHFRMVYAIST